MEPEPEVKIWPVCITLTMFPLPLPRPEPPTRTLSVLKVLTALTLESTVLISETGGADPLVGVSPISAAAADALREDAVRVPTLCNNVSDVADIHRSGVVAGAAVAADGKDDRLVLAFAVDRLAVLVRLRAAGDEERKASGRPAVTAPPQCSAPECRRLLRQRC